MIREALVETRSEMVIGLIRDVFKELQNSKIGSRDV